VIHCAAGRSKIAQRVGSGLIGKSPEHVIGIGQLHKQS
jgi:hypothetical protein